MYIDQSSIQAGETTEQPWTAYYEANTATAVEETIADADLQSLEATDGSGTTW